MKKALIALLVLSMIGTAAFAEDSVVRLSASGGLQLWWGMDLDTGATGFANVNDSVTAKVDIGPAAAAFSKGGEGSYGYISIDGLKIHGEGGASGATVQIQFDSITGKLVLGPATLAFWSVPGVSIGFTGGPWLKDAVDFSIYSGTYGGTAGGNQVSDSGGSNTYFGSVGFLSIDAAGMTGGFDFSYTADKVITAGLVVKSAGDWTTNVANNYAFKVYANLLAVDGLTFNVAANMATGGTNVGLGGKVAYAIKAGDISITPAVAFDMLGATYDLMGGLAVEMMKSTLTVNFGMDDTAAWALTVAANVGMVDGLTAQFAFETFSSTYMGIFFNLGYAIKADALTITPYVKGSFDTLAAGVSAFFLKAGVDVTGLLANTTFSLVYESDDMAAAAPNSGYMKIGAKVSF